ncbi:MAG: MMPL family transporter [Candidatus Woesearchaeota archaeon]
MSFLEKMLSSVAVLQKKHGIPIIIVVFMITVFLALGIGKVEMQSDFTKEMPQDLPIMILNEKIQDTFSGQDTVFVIFQLDDSIDARSIPRDIRSEESFSYLVKLEDSLTSNPIIESVTSPVTFIRSFPLDSDRGIKEALSNVPAANSFISRDYKTMVMFISADLGNSDKKINEMTELVEGTINDFSKPPGIKVMFTGNPPMRMLIFDLLGKDSIYTIILASIIILILLSLMERSIPKALLIFTPLIIGLIWTMGTLGWLGIKISVATAGLGAMILGLGVESGVFMYTRYHEEREKGKDQLESLKVAVPGVGSAILGSGTTTIIGFLALTISVMPMLQKLGISLALGIFYCLVAAVFIEPVIITFEEKFHHWYTEKMTKRYSEKHSANKKKGM